MMTVKLSFEQRKFILKCYWKCGNLVEVQRQLRKEFQTNLPMRLTITRIRDVWSQWNCSECPREAFWKTMDIDKAHKARKSTGNISPKSKKVWVASESCGRYFKIVCPMHFETLSMEKLQRLVHAVNGDDPDQRVELDPTLMRSYHTGGLDKGVS